jgi:hypothetical protein
MAQPFPMYPVFDARAARDAQKWGRWPLWRRLLKRLMNPERAAQMSNAHATAQLLAAQQPVRQRQDPAYWHASRYIKGLF